MEQLLEGFAVTWGLMLPQFDRDVFDISPDKIAKVDNLHIPDLPMLHFPQNLTQSKKYSYHVTYHVTPKSFEQLLPSNFFRTLCWHEMCCLFKISRSMSFFIHSIHSNVNNTGNIWKLPWTILCIGFVMQEKKLAILQLQQNCMFFWSKNKLP